MEPDKTAEQPAPTEDDEHALPPEIKAQLSEIPEDSQEPELPSHAADAPLPQTEQLILPPKRRGGPVLIIVLILILLAGAGVTYYYWNKHKNKTNPAPASQTIQIQNSSQ